MADSSLAPAADQLLLTKLFAPLPRGNLVARPLLLAKLARGLEGPLTLISAPAGFGKTTVIGAWRASPEGRAYRLAWLSLEPDDDEPARFMRYVVAALDSCQPGVGERAAALLRSPAPPPVRAVVAMLLNELTALPDPFALVLDDCHTLESPAVHDVLAYLLEHQPPQMHMVILSRTDPPLPLARLRARGQLVEIRADDLRFTLDEAAGFLNEVMELGLTERNVSRLAERTEGWIAGLQLAALSLRGAPDAASFVDSFAGSTRLVAEYLIDEVVASQPEAVQRFLLATSILERFCAPLCDAILALEPVDWIQSDVQAVGGGPVGRPAQGSQAVLERLERGNLFLIPLDTEGAWYRYHHLFRDFLRARLRRTEPDRLGALHRAASEWLESRGLLSEALGHALQTGNHDYAADLVERHGVAPRSPARLKLLDDACSALPEGVIERRPALAILQAWARVFSLRDEERATVEGRVALAERALLEQDLPVEAPVGPGRTMVPLREWVTGQAAAIRSHLYPSLGTPVDPAQQVALSQRALELLPEVERPIRAATTLNLALARMAMGDVDAADATLAEARRLALDAGNYFSATTTIYQQSRLAFCRGRLHRAAEICRDGKRTLVDRLGLPADRSLEGYPPLQALDLSLGSIMLEWNDLEGAQHCLLRDRVMLGWSQWMEVAGCTLIARLREIQGDRQGFDAAVARLEELSPELERLAQALRMLRQVRECSDDPDSLRLAAAWVRDVQSDPVVALIMPGVGPQSCGVAYTARLAQAEVQIAVGAAQEALAFVEPMLRAATAKGLSYRAVELSIAEALALHSLGQNRQAVESLGRALALAEPEGYVRIFDQGPTLIRLLAEAAGRGIARGYVERLLEAIGSSADGRVSRGETTALPPNASAARRRQPPSADPLAEPLTERELEVLRLIADGLSNPEIAAKLYVEVSTVKRHVNHIFGKLDVSSRTQAVARARASGLI